MRLWWFWLLALPAFAQQATFINLAGTWQSFAGDRPEFAAPGFDDHAWKPMTVPTDWSQWIGRPGVLWLRRRVQLPADADSGHLTLTLGTVPIYEVYVNGRRIGATGSFDSFADASIPRPRTFDIPASTVAGAGALQIALRIRRIPRVGPDWLLPDRGPYVVADRAAAPLEAGQTQVDHHFIVYSLNLLAAALLFVIGLLSAVAWFLDRERPEFLWFAAGTSAETVFCVYLAWVLLTDAHPFNATGESGTSYLASASIPLLAQFTVTALRGGTWRSAPVWLVWTPLFVFYLVTHFSGNQIFMADEWCGLYSIFVIGWDWRRRGLRTMRFEEHLFRVTLLLLALDRAYTYTILLLGGSATSALYIQLGAFLLQRGLLFLLALSAAILVLLFRRLIADRRDKHRLAGELEAARSVQQFLLKEPVARAGAMPIEAVYRPAHEVGGDFYQIFPLSDGSDLLAVGDVSGKGLKAAMVVSLLTGALRNRKSDQPAELLGELNRTVCGGLDGGFVTAAVARCYPDGRVILANAGNPAPYLAGQEVPLVAGLPLGIAREAEYADAGLALGKNQQLTFVSDGVVEAANANGELFGFERTQQIGGKSAHEIADAAKSWGQNDDITVLTVRRTV